MDTQYLADGISYLLTKLQHPTLGSSLDSLIKAIIFLVVVYILFDRIDGKRHYFWNLVKNHLLFWFSIVWIMGFISYYVGITISMGDQSNVLTATPMAILAAFGMFLSQSDISLVQEAFHSSPLWMALFSVSHFCAVCLSLVFVIKHFGNYFRFLVRRWWCCRTLAPSTDELYVFWGLNQGSVLLANNILNLKDSESQKTTRRVVLIHTTDETEAQNERMGIARLFNMITLKNEKLQQLQENGGIVFNSFNRLSSLNISNIRNSSAENECDILQEVLSLRSLVRLINRKTKKGIHFFMLSEDTKANANAVVNLLQDRNIAQVPKANHERPSITIHCLANRDETELLRNTIQAPSDSKVTVDIIDRASLSMLQLKRGMVEPGQSHPTRYGEHHPISYIKVDTEHVHALESFDALIIGFGETGKEALSFLYEFSALPNAEGQKNETNITVIDSEMDSMRGLFYEQHPAFKQDNSEIRLLQADINSESFAEAVNEMLQDLDYVVISLGDDDQNLDVATRLFNVAYRYKNSESQKKEKPELGIYLRCNSMDNYERMSTIVTKLNDSVRLNDKQGVIQLHVFGSPQGIFTYSLIVENTPLVEAKEYNWVYEKEGRNRKDKDGNPVLWTRDSLWDECFNLGNTMDKRKCSRKVAQQEIFRKVQQNLSNSLHLDTKLALIGLSRTVVDDQKTLSELRQIVSQRQSQKTFYPNQEWAPRLTNLAICEHLRWEASHKMLGYVFTGSYSIDSYEAAKKLNCMCPWQDIKKEDTQSYDCDVVDTSIKIALSNK